MNEKEILIERVQFQWICCA